MDSRTIYVGHREPPPGAEAYIPQRFPDNRIVSSKVPIFSFIHLDKSAEAIISVYFFKFFPVYFSFPQPAKVKSRYHRFLLEKPIAHLSLK